MHTYVTLLSMCNSASCKSFTMPLHRHFHDFYSPQVELLLCGELKETGVGMVDCQSKSQTTTQPSQLTNNAQLSGENLTSITLDHLCLVIHA